MAQARPTRPDPTMATLSFMIVLLEQRLRPTLIFRPAICLMMSTTTSYCNCRVRQQQKNAFSVMHRFKVSVAYTIR